MADSENPGLFSFTKPVIMTFPNLVEARAFKSKNGKETGEPKFDGNFEQVENHPDVIAAKTLAVALAKAKWPGREIVPWNNTPGFQNPRDALMFPFHKGDTIADEAKANGKDREFSRGRSVLTARSKYRPGLAVVLNGRVVDINKTDDKEVAANGKHFYHGCEVLVQVNFQAYDGVGQNPDGVTAYLQHVLSFNTGEHLKGGGGGRTAAEVFGGHIGLTTDEDPTVGQTSLAGLI